MITILLALISSLAGTLGGRTGALVGQVVNTIGTVTLDQAALETFAGPWIKWLNAMVDANRDPTPEEDAAALALADAIHANNVSLGTGGQGVPLPSPPGT